MHLDYHDFLDSLDKPEASEYPQVRLRIGVVDSAASGTPPRVNVKIGDSTVATTGVRFLKGSTPAIGDVVALLQVEGTYIIVGVLAPTTGGGGSAVTSVNTRTGDVTGLAEDNTVVHLTGAETVAGIKTFTSIPVLPASDPTTDNQAVRKLYVDTRATTVTQDTKTANYTLVLADAGKLIEMNVASANTLTVPPNSSVAFAIGTVIGWRQYGAGQITLTPGSGVTIRASGTKLKSAAIYSEGSLTKRGTDEWVAAGDLSA